MSESQLQQSSLINFKHRKLFFYDYIFGVLNLAITPDIIFSENDKNKVAYKDNYFFDRRQD